MCTKFKNQAVMVRAQVEGKWTIPVSYWLLTSVVIIHSFLMECQDDKKKVRIRSDVRGVKKEYLARSLK